MTPTETWESEVLEQHHHGVALTLSLAILVPCLLVAFGIVEAPPMLAASSVLVRVWAVAGLALLVLHKHPRRMMYAASAWVIAGCLGWLACLARLTVISPEITWVSRTLAASVEAMDPAQLEQLTAINVGLGLTFLFSVLTTSVLPLGTRGVLVTLGLLTSAGAAVWYQCDLRPELLAAFVLLVGGGAMFPIMTNLSVRRGAQRDAEVAALRQREAVTRHEHELDLARSIQRSMIPPATWQARLPVTVRSLHVSHHRVGGDWLALRETADGRVIALVLDVTGKGMAAALVAHAVQSIWAMMLKDALFDPRQFLERVNEALFRLGGGRSHTATAGIAEISAGHVFYWTAGHVPLKAFVRGEEQEEYRQLWGHGDMLGIGPVLKLKPAVLEIAPGQRLTALIGSDGVFDGISRGKRAQFAFLTQLREEGWAAVEALTVEDDKTLMWIDYGGDGTGSER